jgi:hypothetical protein
MRSYAQNDQVQGTIVEARKANWRLITVNSDVYRNGSVFEYITVQ